MTTEVDLTRRRSQRSVSEDLLHGLPEVVQRYLNFTGVVGTPVPNSVKLKYSGRFRTGADRPWMPLKAIQTYTTDSPGFIWDARFKILGLPLLRARDEYRSGQAHMLGKLAGLYTVFDVTGEELAQAAMIRYLSEMIWFPAAFLGDNITWKAIDHSSAEVWFEDRGRRVSGMMDFNDQGRVTAFTAQRYRVDGDRFYLNTWSTPITGYDVYAGLNLPASGKAVWNLESGDLNYIEMALMELQYDP